MTNNSHPNSLDATVFVYRNADGVIRCEYRSRALALQGDPAWELIASIEPRSWIEAHWDDAAMGRA